MSSSFGSAQVQRGASIIELLVGVAVGLIVVTGAVKLMSDTMGSNRRLMLETRVNQDLRAAADLIVRDIRRAGYWNNAASGVFSATGATATPNPYRNIDLASNVIKYTFARDGNDTVEAPEWAGYRLNAGAIEMLVSRDETASPPSESWQPITDPKVVTVTALEVTPLATSRRAELFSYCSCMTALTCTAADFGPGGAHEKMRLQLAIEQFDIRLVAQAVADASVRREIREAVRVRNDRLSNPYGRLGCCPSPNRPLGCCPDPADPTNASKKCCVDPSDPSKQICT